MKLPLASRLVLVFMLFAAALLVAVGLLAYRSGSQSLQAAVVSQMVSISLEKEAALNNWIEERQEAIELIAAHADVADKVARLIAAAPGSSQARSAHAALLAELQPHVASRRTAFGEVFVMEPSGGTVVASTRPAEEGKSKAGHPYFDHGKAAFHLQPLYRSRDLGVPAMTAAVPLRAAHGQVVAVLGFRLDITVLVSVVQRRAGLFRSEDAYLVDAERFVATQPRFMNDPAVLAVRLDSEAAQRVAARMNGVWLGPDYRGMPVISVYRWIPSHRLGLLVEVDAAEALAPAHAFGRSLLLISGLVLLAAACVALRLARTLTRPLLAVHDKVRAFGAAGAEAAPPDPGGDEIGLLAREFDRMAARIGRREAEIVQSNREVQALSEANAIAAKVIENAAEAVMVIDAELRIESVNPAFERITGYSAAESLGRKPRILFSGRHDDDFFHRLHEQVDERGQWHGEIWNRRHDGELYPQQTSINVLRDAQGRIRHYASVFSDNTARHRLEARLRDLAALDGLTGIANRRSFDEALASEWARAQREGQPLSLMLADVDHFKPYNDHHGHPAGDTCLRRVAQAVAAAAQRAGDLAARYGGEEFVVILPNTDAGAAEQVAQRVRAAVAALGLPHGASDAAAFVTVSIGVATWLPALRPAPPASADTLLGQADHALYEAKASGRNRVVAFGALEPASGHA